MATAAQTTGTIPASATPPADPPPSPTGQALVLGADRATLRTTRFSDVCGGTDEFKRLISESPEVSNDLRATARDLVDDGLYMLGRMEVRLRQYQAYRDALAQLVERMRAIPEPRLAIAAQEAARIRHALAQGDALPVSELIHHVEEIRQVANDMEGALRRHKEAAIEASNAYLALRGGRGWQGGSEGSPASAGGAEAAGAATQPGGTAGEALPPGVPEAWLPPAPHRDLILDWLRRGRATLLSDEEMAKYPAGPQGREPLVQFEDGGVMPLRVVRWSEEVRNFYPLGQDPNPRGRLYRGRSATPAASG